MSKLTADKTSLVGTLPFMIKGFICPFLVCLSFASASNALAGEVRVASASNFSAVAREISTAFEASTGHTVTLSFGSTGQLYTQISLGAPFDVFLAADSARPVLMIETGLADADSLFTYALGRLALYQPDAVTPVSGETLKNSSIGRIAIANPATAPYGIAAMETLDALGLVGAVCDKLVRGTNIAQAYQFVATGHAEIGLVAKSQVLDADPDTVWPVPETLHKPISQNAILVQGAQTNPAAVAYLDFLGGPDAQTIIVDHGYDMADR